MVGNILQPSFYVTGANGVATKGVLTGTITVTGTFSGVATHKVITGTGTLFKSELQIGDWLYSTTLNEVRKIIRIHDDFKLGLDRAFSGTNTANAMKIARRSSARSVVVKDSGTTGTSLINNVLPIKGGYAQSFNNSESGINAMTYDASAVGAQLDVTISY